MMYGMNQKEMKSYANIFTKVTASIKQELDKIDYLVCESIFAPPANSWGYNHTPICTVRIKELEDAKLPAISIYGSVREKNLTRSLYVSVSCTVFNKTRTYKINPNGNFNLKLLIKRIQETILVLTTNNLRICLNKINQEATNNKDERIKKITLGAIQDSNTKFAVQESGYGKIDLKLDESIELHVRPQIKYDPNPQINVGISGGMPLTVLLEIITMLSKNHGDEVIEEDKKEN